MRCTRNPSGVAPIARRTLSEISCAAALTALAPVEMQPHGPGIGLVDQARGDSLESDLAAQFFCGTDGVIRRTGGALVEQRKSVSLQDTVDVIWTEPAVALVQRVRQEHTHIVLADVSENGWFVQRLRPPRRVAVGMRQGDGGRLGVW